MVKETLRIERSLDDKYKDVCVQLIELQQMFLYTCRQIENSMNPEANFEYFLNQDGRDWWSMRTPSMKNSTFKDFVQDENWNS